MATTIKTGGCAKSTDPCNPEPRACPSCGGLECLCRPRFFAGQLLTEENLNHLNSYIIKKNRLHNRYLYGSGVVCGLQVSCEPCDDRRVRVAEGYALSPCGNDIIVCEEDSVDICDLIKDCRGDEPRDCRPYARPDRQCEGAEETWILAICYEEQSSRGITALRSETAGSCYDPAPRGAPPQCEPTQVCEGYHYRLFKLPEATTDNRFSTNVAATVSRGAFYDQLTCCLTPLLDLLRSAGQMSNQGWLQQCCHYKVKLKEIILQHASGNCELLRRLDCISCDLPSSTNDNINQNAAFQLFLIAWQLLIDCLCNSLMPPCPGEEPDDCVPLAAITVSGRECRVRKVCNWTEYRKYVITMPTLQYWLSIFTRGRGLGQVLELLCCDARGIMDAFDPCAAVLQQNIDADDNAVNAAAPDLDFSANDTVALDIQPQLDGQWLKGNQDFSSILSSSLGRSAGDLTLGQVIGGLAQTGDEDGEPLLSAAERDNPAEFLTTNLLLQPFIKTFLPQGGEPGSGSLAGGPGFAGGNDAAAASPDIAGLRTEMRALQQSLDSQAAELAELRKQLNGRD